jgi:hypothetical protein
MPAILFTVSAAVIGMFAFSHWRATISRAAKKNISSRICIAAGVTEPGISAQDFRSILSLHDLTQDLRGSNDGFRAVRSYYAVLEKLGRLIPTMAAWTNGEMVTCSRYVAVRLDQRLERNMVSAAQIRGI